MIESLLQQLEREPTARFSERELLERGGEEFAQLRRERLLRRDPIPPGPLHRVVGGQALLYLDGPDGQRFGVDVDDPDADPIPYQIEDVACWRVHIPTLLSGLRTMHGLAGSSRTLNDRMHLVGERASEERSLEAWVLSFLDTAADPLSQLTALPTLLGSGYNAIRVLCPSFLPAPSDAAALQRIGVSVSLLRPAVEAGHAPAVDGWSHSPLFDSVGYAGKSYALTKTEASVLQAFDRARGSGHPLLSLRELLDEVERPSSHRIKDLFTRRNRELVGTLIVEDGRGRYRLNLPVPSRSTP